MILATSAESEHSSKLSILVWFVTVVIVISVIVVNRTSSTTGDLDRLAYKGPTWKEPARVSSVLVLINSLVLVG